MEINHTLTTENLDQPIFQPKDQSLSFWQALWYGVQFLLLQILFIIPVMIIGFATFEIDYEVSGTNFIMGFGLPIAFIGVAWVFYKRRGLIATAFHWKSNFVKLIPLSLLLLYGVIYIISELISFLPGYEEMLADYLKKFSGMNPFALLIGGVIVGPICEEIIFRGIILEGLSKKYSATTAIIVSALIFGVVHLQSLQIISAFFTGLILGWIYLKTQSLWVVIALHVLNNAYSFLMGDATTESIRAMIGNDLLYLGSFGLAALVAYLGYLGFQKVNQQEAVISKEIQA